MRKRTAARSFLIPHGGRTTLVGGLGALYRIDLATGAATRIGTIGGGEAVSGLAIEP